MPQGDITLVNVSTPVPRNEADDRVVFAPLGCLYLISALERAGIVVDFRDFQLFDPGSSFHLDKDNFETFLNDSAPIVGISCMVSMLPFVTLGAKKFKELNPHHTIILGGPGPSGVAESIVSSLPWIDVVCRGEGEETIVELVNAVSKGSDLGTVKGITYRDSRGVHSTPPRTRIQNPDDIPFPAYDRIDFSDYNSVSVITARGCPYKCAFCDVGPLWGNKTRFRSIDNVVEELSFLKNEHGQNTIHVADDTFDLKRNRTETLCREMDRLRMNWTCLARVDLIDEDLLERMAGAGCRSIFLGIESGSDAVLKKINKKFTIAEATEKAELAKKYIDKVITSYIWGFPFETTEDFKSTLLSIVSMWYLDAMAGLKLLSPMPLSPLGIEYRDHLEFSEELCSVFASLGNVTSTKSTHRASLPDEFREIIERHPDIFMGFYHIKTENLEEKAEYLRKFAKRMDIPV